jgi:putative endonuclease
MRVKDVLGRWGEQLAVDALHARGLEVIARNWRRPEGEIDIVARDGRTVVFCEVKTRSSANCGVPVEAVTPRKAQRLRKLALLWLAEHPGAADVRFDVVSITRQRRGPATVEHVVAAF